MSIIKLAYSQKVFWLWSHSQKKVQNLFPEQKIWINYLTNRAGNSNFLFRGVIWHLLLAMGPKIPSDIKQNLHTIFEKGFYLQFWNTLIFVVAILGIAFKMADSKKGHFSKPPILNIFLWKSTGFWKWPFFQSAILNFFFKKIFFLLHSHEN